MSQRYEPLVQEDLNIGTAMTFVGAPGGGELRSTQVGLHSVARGQRAYEASWTPGAILTTGKASITVTVPDAATGDLVLASHDQILTSDLRITGHVSAADTVTVVIHNPTGSTVTVGAGTVAVIVFPFIGFAAPSPPGGTASVTGTVYYYHPEAPGPWPGATVTMTVDGVPWPGGPATTDGDGIYLFTDVPAGAIVVSVSGTAPLGGEQSGSNNGVTVPPVTLNLDVSTSPT